MMAPTIVARRDGQPRLVVGSAGSARLRGAIMQIVVNVLDHGLGVAAAIDAPRVHLDEPPSTARAGTTRTRSTGSPTRLRARPLAAPQPLLRRRRGCRGARRRALAAAGDPRRGGAGIARRDDAVGPAGGARRRARIVALASAVASERRAGCSPTRRWRSVADERRYIRAVRRHPDAAVARRRAATVRSSGGFGHPRPHPASAHVADLGLMVAALAAGAGSAPR